jgi:hypothetical protein
VSRRFALILVALMATASVVLAACGAQAPAAPALSDPKEILTATVLSLKDVKTVEFTGSFTGNLDVPELGTPLDLSTVKISGAADISGKAKLTVDAPTILGTKIDALVVGSSAYYKIAGPLAAMAGASADKFTKVDVPQESGKPVTDAAELAKAIDQFKTALDKLPTPPTKGADEKCGDQDCYHVTLKMTAADIKALDPTSTTSEGDFSLDLWSRKNDLRPAKIQLSVTTPQTGTVGMVFDLKYDVTVSVEAPPADQIAP